jgi:hypothetical protein
MEKILNLTDKERTAIQARSGLQEPTKKDRMTIKRRFATAKEMISMFKDNEEERIRALEIIAENLAELALRYSIPFCMIGINPFCDADRGDFERALEKALKAKGITPVYSLTVNFSSAADTTVLEEGKDDLESLDESWEGQDERRAGVKKMYVRQDKFTETIKWYVVA